MDNKLKPKPAFDGRLGHEEKKLHSILQPPHKELEEEKLTGCQLVRRKCFGTDVRSSAGMCMIAFAVPLLLPGVTLTVVAFDDETGFSKYSALHVIGMMLLALAGLLIITGIFLNIRFSSKVAPDDDLHTVSTHDKPLKDLDLDKDVPATDEDIHNREESRMARDDPNPNMPPVNFLVGTGHSVAGGEHHVQFQDMAVGMSAYGQSKNLPLKDTNTNLNQGESSAKQPSSKIAKTSLSSSTSSLCTSDSDDCSSGSYVISGEYDGQQSNLGYISEEEDVSVVDNSQASSPGKATHTHHDHLLKNNKPESQCDPWILPTASDKDEQKRISKPNNFFTVSTEQPFPSNYVNTRNDLLSTDKSCDGNTNPFANNYLENTSPNTRSRLKACSLDPGSVQQRSRASRSASTELVEDDILTTCSGSDSNSSVFSRSKSEAREVNDAMEVRGRSVSPDFSDHIRVRNMQRKRLSSMESKHRHSAPAWGAAPPELSADQQELLATPYILSESSGAITDRNCVNKNHASRPVNNENPTAVDEQRHDTQPKITSYTSPCSPTLPVSANSGADTMTHVYFTELPGHDLSSQRKPRPPLSPSSSLELPCRQSETPKPLPKLTTRRFSSDKLIPSHFPSPAKSSCPPTLSRGTSSSHSLDVRLSDPLRTQHHSGTGSSD